MQIQGLFIDGEGYECLVALDPRDGRIAVIAVFAEGEDAPIVSFAIPAVTLKLFLGGV